MSSVRLAGCRALVLLAAAGASAAWAQWREGEQPVVTPALPAASAPQDVVTPFRRAYQAAGRPRVVLLWNRELSDQASTATMQRLEIHDTANGRGGGSSQTTAGLAGSASTYDHSGGSNRSLVASAGTVALTAPARSTALSERETAMLEQAFLSAMGRGGMRFIDRALVMRTTAATQHRGGGDPQLIETDALMKNGDMIMEVLLVDDKDAPLGYAFDIRLKDLHQGVAVSTLYSRAIPAPRAQPAGQWQAGTNGYEYRPTVPQLKIADIGEALARDVMAGLEPAFRR